MKTLLKRITSIGVDDTLPSSERKYITLTNAVSLVAAISIALQIPLFMRYWPATERFIVMQVTWVVVFQGVFLLNFLRLHLAAKVFVLLVPMVFFALFDLHTGSRGNVYLLNILLMIVAFFSFLKRERVYMIIMVTLAAGSFCYFVLRGPGYEPWIALPESFYTENRVAILLTVFFTSSFFLFFISRILREADENLELEKKKSDELLLNILPVKVAEELKEKGFSQPEDYNQVTVLFTDFVGFTQIAENMQPRELVAELDRCFSYFDKVTEKYGLEKLKTIGDAYMAAGGIPVANTTNAVDCTLAALEIQSFMQQMAQIKADQGLPYWQLRMGLHTGHLVAGVVGEKKFLYDVWGDTVNLASRMESSGLPGRINISEDTWQLIKDFFICEPRGRVKAKNKGEVEMYFVKGIKPGLSEGGEGRVPGRKFKELYEALT